MAYRLYASVRASPAPSGTSKCGLSAYYWYNDPMVFRKVDGGYVLRLVRGEELVKTLNGFCEAEKVTAD